MDMLCYVALKLNTCEYLLLTWLVCMGPEWGMGNGEGPGKAGNGMGMGRPGEGLARFVNIADMDAIKETER